MPAKIIQSSEHATLDIARFQDIYGRGNSESKRMDPVDHETLVPVLYTLTGSNLRNTRTQFRSLYKNIYDNESDEYVWCIACVDYKDIKKVRKDLISALINNNLSIKIDNISYVIDEENNNLSIPSDFIAKKELLTDIQNNLPNMIRQSIEKDNELGLTITN